MYKDTCKTTKFIDFKIQKYSPSLTIYYHFDTLFLYLKFLWHGYCLIWNTNVCCHIPSPGMFPMGFPTGMTFLWTSLCFWYMHQITIAFTVALFYV